MKKDIKERFSRFFEEPTRDKLREILQGNTGEYNNLDFKKEWPESSKISRHILALANTCGGAIIIGVEETDDGCLHSCGVESIEDKSTIDVKLRKYVPDEIDYLIMDFSYTTSDYKDLEGKSFQVLIVDYDETIIPLISRHEGASIKKDTIYIRKGTNSIPADYHSLQKILNNRIATYTDTSSSIKIEEHLNQLKTLYNQIDKYHIRYNAEGGSFMSSFNKSLSQMLNGLYGEKEKVKNPNYPEEDYEEFISILIKKKKIRIEKTLDV